MGAIGCIGLKSIQAITIIEENIRSKQHVDNITYKFK